METLTNLQSLDCETIQGMKSTLGESFAHLGNYYFDNEGNNREQFDTILGTLCDFHHVLTIVQKGISHE